MQAFKALAKRLTLAVRSHDSIARLGGDEFVAVLADLSHAEQAEPLLQRLLQAASETVCVGELTLKVSASIGATIYPHDDADAEQLIRHADQAMYIAKQAGKNRIQFFDVTTNSAAKVQGEALTRLQRALDKDELRLHFQPKVDMRTNLVFGVEALLRWEHPEKGLLAPGLFLPSIENQPVSVLVGEWVLENALSQLRAWNEIGLSLEVSVNVSAFQLLKSDFASKLVTLLDRYPDVNRAHLTLEILETSALDDTVRVAGLIRECQALGLSFALDDFGTGYSSLTYLRNLPVENLKIDRSFVRDMLIDRDDMAIVKGVIALARTFKRRVIAEGVESAAHMARLRRLGCDAAQGFGIARPMPAADIPEWVRANQATQSKVSISVAKKSVPTLRPRLVISGTPKPRASSSHSSGSRPGSFTPESTQP